MRFLLVCAALAAGGLLSAQSNYFVSTTPGYAVAQHDVPFAGSTSFSLPGGADWDPSGSDFYYYDSAAEVIRRFDTAASAPAATALFTVPNPVFGPYVDSLAFDPFVTTDLYAIESGAQVLHKLRRSGLDTLNPAFGTGGVLTGPQYAFYPFDLEFDTFGRLFCIGSSGGSISGVFLIDKTTLAATQVVDINSPAGAPFSGPIAFDAMGNLHIGLPPATFGALSPFRIVRFDKAALDVAVNSSGATVLAMGDGTMVVDALDGFPAGGSMAFRTEGGQQVLYFAGYTGDVYRSVLATRAFTVFAFGDVPAPNTEHFHTALCVESSTQDFRPYSGDATRVLVSMATRDGSFVVQNHGLCVLACAGAPSSINSLALTDAPTAMTNGVTYRFEVELRDATDALVTTEAGISVQILSGSGTLGGTLYGVAYSGVAVFDDLVLSGGSGSVILRFSLAGTSVTEDSAVIRVSGGNGGSGSSSLKDSGNGNCSTGSDGANWLALLALGALVAVAARLRGRRPAVAAR
ncbi:MAG: hypothetical protein IT464_11825 [Planctomycetes bacterium]|nr:hypothetical protein [Planctomycetota bacterium]